jgi:hypothetical protein
MRDDPDTFERKELVRKVPAIVRRPHISKMLYDAYSVIHTELAMLHEKVGRGDELTIAEAKKFQIYAQQLAGLAREEREQQKQDKLDEKDDNELLKLAAEATKVLQGT